MLYEDQSIGDQGVTMVLGDRVNTDIHCSTKYLPGKDNQFVVGCAFQELSPGFAEQAAQYRQAGQPLSCWPVPTSASLVSRAGRTNPKRNGCVGGGGQVVCQGFF